MNRLPASPIAGSSNTSSWSGMIGEMSGGQHRVDEVTRTEPVGWTGKKQTENCGAALGRKQRGCTTVGVCPKGIKKELNTLDEADFVRDVEKSSSCHLSQTEIGAIKRDVNKKASPVAGSREIFCLDIQPTVCRWLSIVREVLLWIALPFPRFIFRVVIAPVDSSDLASDSIPWQPWFYPRLWAYRYFWFSEGA